MEYRYDTYCGLYCGACAIIVQNKRQDRQATDEYCGGTSDELRCMGCKSQLISCYCTRCAIRACALSRGVEFCFECREYPCSIIKKFKKDKYPHHSIVLKNLEHIRTLGVEQWLEEQKARWSCNKCGAGFSWYEEICPACGSRLYNCVEEERGL